MSKPTAMISFAFSREKRWTSGRVRLDLKRNFSSSVSWITSGTSKTSCSHLPNKLYSEWERLGEGKGDDVTDVHGVAGGATAGVEKEWLALLVSIQNSSKIPTRLDQCQGGITSD